MKVLFRVKLREGRDFKCERPEYVLCPENEEPVVTEVTTKPRKSDECAKF